MPKVPKELEKVILSLPVKEKDKLLIKLIGKNDLLIKQLYFQFLEDESDLKEKREEIKKSILSASMLEHDMPKWLGMDLRELSSKITMHVRITKDKYGEVELTLYLLNAFFDNQLKKLESYSSRNDDASQYIVKRTEALLKKLSKLHEDYYVEFEREVNKLLKRVHTYAPSYYARQMNLPKRWEY